MAIREMFATLGAMSKEGAEAFQKYLDSFDPEMDWKDIKTFLTPGMLKFLGKADATSEATNE